jgi:hypothetical protein
MADKAQYHTRPLANEGVRLPLRTRDGRDEGDWLLVLGCDSDAFREAKLAHQRAQMEIAQLKTADERRDAKVEADTRLTAALVKAWSWDDLCTVDAVYNDLLKDGPQLIREIDALAFNRDRFFGVKSSNLLGTPKNTSDSQSP